MAREAAQAEQQAAPNPLAEGLAEANARPSLPIVAAADPLDWRTRFHWSRLATLAGQQSGPRFGGELHLEAPASPDWTPFAEQRQQPRGHPYGSMLPLVYSQLVTIEADDFSNAHRTNVTGDLASAWEWPDATTLLFRLEPDVRWPDEPPFDGRALSADEVRIAQEALATGSGLQSGTHDAVARIEADNAAHSVTFRLDEPAAYLLNEMTGPLQVILPPALIADPGLIQPSRSSVGTGPFRLNEASALGSWSVSRNPTYFKRDPASGKALPYLDSIRGSDLHPISMSSEGPGLALNEWYGGGVQSVSVWSAAEAEAATDAYREAVTQVTAPTPGAAPFFAFRDLANGPYADPRVRRALSMAISRLGLAVRGYQGLAAADCGQNWTFVADAASDWGFREWPWEADELGRAFEHDVQAAGELMSAAGYTDDRPLMVGIDAPEDGGSAISSFAAIGRAPGASVWEAAIGELRVALVRGLRVEPIPRERKSRTVEGGGTVGWTDVSEDADLIFTEPFALGVDADELAYRRMHSGAPAYWGGIADAEIDEWGVAQRQATDPLNRSELLERIRLKEAEQVWRLHLVNPYGLAVRREHVFNLVDTYFSKNVETLPKQLERTWLGGCGEEVGCGWGDREVGGEAPLPSVATRQLPPKRGAMGSAAVAPARASEARAGR